MRERSLRCTALCAWTLLGVLAAALMSGCQSRVGLAIIRADVGFNDRLRGDLGPTVDGQSSRYFLDATIAGDQPVAPLAFSSIDPMTQRLLRRSHVFWVERDGFVRLSFEAVLRNIEVPFNEEISVIRSAGSCTAVLSGRTDVSDVETRGTLQINPPLPVGVLRITSFEENFGEYTAAATACTEGDARRDPDSPPTPLTQGCNTRNLRALSSFTREQPAPFCVLGAVGDNLIGDVSYSLQVRNNDLSTLEAKFNAPALALAPNVKVVGEARQIARRLEYLGERRLEDGTRLHRWRWRTLLQDGLWEENFSPNLRIARIWLYRTGRDDTSQRNYLNPVPLEAGPLRGDETLDEVGDCELDHVQRDADGNPFVNAPACLGALTPTYSQGQLLRDVPFEDGDRLAWEYTAAVAPGGQLPFDAASAQLFIAFELAADRFGRSGSSLRAEPAGKDLGGVAVGQPTQFTGAFHLLNDGPASVQITRIAMEGAQSPDFRVRADSGNVPFWVAGGTSGGVTVEIAPQTLGQRRATLVIEGTTPGGAVQTLRLGVQATAQSAALHVLPTKLKFRRDDILPDTAPGALPGFLVLNYGSLPLTRRSMQIRGPHAAFFTVLRSEQGYSTTMPPPASLTLGPGEDEGLRIYYHPVGAGLHTAEIVLETDVGSRTVSLDGSCTGTCRYEAPFAFGQLGAVRIALAESAGTATDPRVSNALMQLTPSAAIALLNLGRADATAGAPAEGARARQTLASHLLSAEHEQRLAAEGLIRREQHPDTGAVAFRLTDQGVLVYRALAGSPALVTHQTNVLH